MLMILLGIIFIGLIIGAVVIGAVSDKKKDNNVK